MDFSQHTPNKKVHNTENDQEANASNLMNLTAHKIVCVIIDVTFLREKRIISSIIPRKITKTHQI